MSTCNNAGPCCGPRSFNSDSSPRDLHLTPGSTGLGKSKPMSRARPSKLHWFLHCCLVVALFLPGLPLSADEMNSTILVGNSKIDVVFQGTDLPTYQERLTHWIRSAAESVSTYYGRFPVSHLLLRVTVTEGRGIRNGTTYGDNGAFIRIRVGKDTPAESFDSDWMLTHEMVHLAFPSVSEHHQWIEEGIATYVEPIARVQANHMDPTRMWFELVRDLHQGLPGEGDQGLDHTHTWGRTYWGGALYCFLADIEIRRETKNKKGLQDALRGILSSGGDITREWDIEKALNAGDHAVGVSVLVALYDKMKDSPYDVDLAALWKQLGLSMDSGELHIDDKAPLASIRKAITTGAPSQVSDSSESQRTFAVDAGRTRNCHVIRDA